MWQTNANRVAFKVLLCALLLICGITNVALADITGLTLDASASGASGNRLNAGASITLTASWSGDSPPFTARFKSGGNVVFTDTQLAAGSSVYSLGTSQIGDTGGTAQQFSVEVLDTAGGLANAVANKSYVVDFTRPTLTATITNGPNFSNSSTVRVQITSDETIKPPTVTSNGVGAAIEGTATPGTSFVYNLPLSSGFANGAHSITITAKDTSEPEASANEGTTSVQFTVGTSVQGATTIATVTPASPTNSSTVTLSGACPDGTSTVEILNNGASINTVGVSGSSWSISLSVGEGSHSFVAISKDTLGTEISRSSASTVIIDQTPPDAPTVTSTLPATTNQTPVNVTLSCNETDASLPIKIQAYNNGVAVGVPTNVNSGACVMNVPLNAGSNSLTFASVDAAGNMSAQTAAVLVNYDNNATTNIILSFESPFVMPLPLATSYQVGGGNYTLKMIFDKNMNQGVKPTLTITCGGGAVITSSSGTWTSATTFSQTFSIPASGGASYDGPVAGLSVSGAYDAYGNAIDAYDYNGSPFYIDCTPPTSAFNDTSTLYVSGANATANLGGTVNDSGSGLSHLDLVWADSTSGTVASVSIPVLSSATTWSYAWDTSALAEGTYNFWVVATDKSQPVGNSEKYTSKTPRTLIVDRSAPTVGTIAINYSTIDINNETQPFTENITRITALINDSGSSGINATTSEMTLTKGGIAVAGEKNYNGSALVYSFSPLGDGEYTIKVTPKDSAGNTGEVASRTFKVTVSVSSNADFKPEYGSYTNKTHPILKEGQVWSILSEGNVSYEKSKITVNYNGSTNGFQVASTTGLVWQFNQLNENQSHDGRYDITVVPTSAGGVTAAPVTSHFFYDSQAPVVTEANPAVNFALKEQVWFGLTQSDIRVTLSDSPKDIVQHGSSMSAQNDPKVSEDASWYNSEGSGVNISTASFSWKMDTNTSPPFAYSGKTLVLAIPTIDPEGSEYAQGAASVAVTLSVEDFAMTGAVEPNKLNLEYSYIYDFMVPVVKSIDAPKAGQVFMGKKINFQGVVEDVGSNEALRVEKLYYSLDGTNWLDFPDAIVPSKTVNFKTSIDISSFEDGSYTLYVKGVDRAGNESAPNSVVFEVDRTPPPAPELTFPINDYLVNKRNQTFKWVTVSGADKYLLQIADDAAFNNIVNSQVFASPYDKLKGQLASTADATYSLPKDGVFYWRVGSIATKDDGINYGNYSQSRKIVVDTVKPYILEVTPSPSSSNKITNGMVTFAIRFSEAMDPTISLDVTLTSAGGQSMKIERVSYSDNTWTGTTVIPKGQSAELDGNAIITIEGAADLAGNIMVSDSSHGVVINTGPVFTTRLFSNPANAYEITILTKASESLAAPPSCSVEQNGISTPVAMNFLRQRYYAGSYKIDSANPGKAYIYLSGTDLHGMVGNGYVQFIVADLSGSQRLNIATENNMATLKAAEGSAYSDTGIYMLDRDSLESPFMENESDALRGSLGLRASAALGATAAELVPVAALEEIGPSTVKLRKRLLFEANLGNAVVSVPADKVHLYRQDGSGKWIFEGGSYADNKVAAQLSGLGRLALMADLKEPVADNLYPRELDEIDGTNAEFRGEFVDNGSGLDQGSFKLTLDGLDIPNVKLDANGSFKYKHSVPLSKGKHELAYSISDYAGNQLSKTLRFDAVLFELEEFTPYPSPARGNKITFQYKFGLAPDSVSMRIYDTAGHLVANISDAFDKANGRADYNLLNRKGKRIANGVYFYKMKVTKNGKSFSKTGKFAVLR
jgi:hypothetical protein